MTWMVRITETGDSRRSRMEHGDVRRTVQTVFPGSTVEVEWIPDPEDAHRWYLDRLKEEVITDREAAGTSRFVTEYSGLSLARMVMRFRDMMFKYSDKKISLPDAVQIVRPLYNEIKENF